MVVRRWTRDARLSLARLPAFGIGRVPDAPAHPIRDPWPGDPAQGAQLMRGSLTVDGVAVAVAPGQWATQGVPEAARAQVLGFAWLRDLRALGTDAARLRARALVGDWLAQARPDPLSRAAEVVGARLAAWLGHYDFFAASADDGFRQRLMGRLLADARTLAASVPTPMHDVRALVALKGLIVAGVAMPENSGFLARAMRYLTPELNRQVLPDGCHAARSPAVQLAVLRELIEIRIALAASQIGPPLALSACLDRMAPVLRAMRHGDGGLALFNGTRESSAAMVDLVLQQAGRGRVAASEMREGGFQRISSGRAALLMDCGPPAPPGFDREVHAGTLSFELSFGRERMIVNCGAAISPAWRDALRATAAHSTLTVEDRNSTELRPGGGIGRRPKTVSVERNESGQAVWLDASHDGYEPNFAVRHRRKLYVGANGDEIIGEDSLEGARGRAPPRRFAVRFHLHPSVRVRLDDEPDAVVITLPGSGAARFLMRVDGGTPVLEESVYCGGDKPVPTQQIVVQVGLPAEETAAARSEDGHDAQDIGADTAQPGAEASSAAQTVRWALTRLD
ncbi:putative heparinase superfamily protein [Endobacter medicaginis]|uniref:Putative heparinase superfamily protein n=2 Tax=Endobacter medicaginis TaxID=1181271 RepID=A0A839UZ37_9PROT|nr:heparinase II/III family protein [Endobacter medicaginis]MBB3175056.1 putative heparinase superfamily protein [Endobacter medicaginis]MCX5476325.1 heparinase II/III family protein [Endobacter medicaginis]